MSAEFDNKTSNDSDFESNMVKRLLDFESDTAKRLKRVSAWLMQTYPFLSKYTTQKRLTYAMEDIVNTYTEKSGQSVSSVLDNIFMGRYGFAISIRIYPPDETPTLYLDLTSHYGTEVLYSKPLRALDPTILERL